jgi:hypothetical protein
MSDFDTILTPKEVTSLMPPSIPESWVYAHWEDLGGVTIGRRKLILKGVFYANLQAKKMVLCESPDKRGEMDTGKGPHDGATLADQEGGQTGRSGTENVGCGKAEGQVYTNHTNEYGLVDALQRLPGRRKS